MTEVPDIGPSHQGHLLRYRTLTHTNVGWCTVTVHERAGRAPLAVVRDSDGHLGPKVRPAARMVAATIHRELFADGREWVMILVGYDGGWTQVTFEQAFDGWYGRPTYTPLTTAQAELLLAAGTSAARAK